MDIQRGFDPEAFRPQHPEFAAAVQASFARQGFLRTIGAELVMVSPGTVEVALPYRTDLGQQHGAVHASVITAIVDVACGYAALSLMPAGSEVLTVEYKVNFLTPALGDRFVARGEVVRSGKRLAVCRGKVVAEQAGTRTPVAEMLATMIRMSDK